jgi:hypothetical protein
VISREDAEAQRDSFLSFSLRLCNFACDGFLVNREVAHFSSDYGLTALGAGIDQAEIEHVSRDALYRPVDAVKAVVVGHLAALALAAVFFAFDFFAFSLSGLFYSTDFQNLQLTSVARL